MEALSRVECDAAPKGYSGYASIRLRKETAEKFKVLRKAVNQRGGLLLSAGGTRDIGAEVGPGRSMVSMHYLGRAFDLPPYSGAFTLKDPYLVVPGRKTAEVLFRDNRDAGMCVAVAALGTQKKFLESKGAIVTAEAVGSFSSLTELAEQAGLHGIGPRKEFYKGHYGSWEWWHFEDRDGLVEGAKFLDELGDTARNMGKEHREAVRSYVWSVERGSWVK